jgi:hypothetical protein
MSEPTYAQRYYQQTKDEQKARSRERYKKNVDSVRANVRRAQLKALYGITPEQYDSMLAAQGGHCALCPAVRGDRRCARLHVDHNHVTGKVRGLLCRDCNTGLGIYEKFAANDRVAGYLKP